MPRASSGGLRTERVPSLQVISGGRSKRPSAVSTAKAGTRAGADRDGKGKRVQFDLETWHALNMLARDRMMSFQELADEAFRDLLSKHGHPVDLKDALKRSVAEAKPQHRQNEKRSTRRPKE